MRPTILYTSIYSVFEPLTRLQLMRWKVQWRERSEGIAVIGLQGAIAISNDGTISCARHSLDLLSALNSTPTIHISCFAVAPTGRLILPMAVFASSSDGVSPTADHDACSGPPSSTFQPRFEHGRKALPMAQAALSSTVQ